MEYFNDSIFHEGGDFEWWLFEKFRPLPQKHTISQHPLGECYR